jgi:hydroxymethylpyrimidine/phosphomethylpyrimidine kinase
MTNKRPITLSIAGFDPTGGAGILADIKTFEQQKCLGMGIITANTYQTEDNFFSVDWLPVSFIVQQLNLIIATYKIGFVKIGLVENFTVLHTICDVLRSNIPEVFILWDPIVSASAGYSFLPNISQTNLNKILEKIDLITPNTSEIKQLTGIDDEIKAAEFLATQCSVLLKGGHSSDKTKKGVDKLFCLGSVFAIEPIMETFYDKHGTGCILSSAIISNLAKGENIEVACKKAKIYLEIIANCNQSLLAYHNV